MIKATTLFVSALVLVACGGATPAATDPSVTNATPPETPATPATPATPEKPAVETPATPAAPEKPADKPAAPETAKDNCPAAKEAGGKDLKTCKATCTKLSDKAPKDSKCVPEKTACNTACDTKFKK